MATAIETKKRPARGFAHESSKNESFDWYTPKEIFDGLDMVFDLDPCSPGAGNSFVPALKHYTIEDDGLTSPWHGTVWMNPPYGPLTATWMEKLSEHGDGIALVFARTDTQWFHRYVANKASMVCFVESRIRFYKGNTTDRGDSPGAGSMLIAYGEKAAAALAQADLGACMTFAPQAVDLAVAA